MKNVIARSKTVAISLDYQVCPTALASLLGKPDSAVPLSRWPLKYQIPSPDCFEASEPLAMTFKQGSGDDAAGKRSIQ